MRNNSLDGHYEVGDLNGICNVLLWVLSFNSCTLYTAASSSPLLIISPVKSLSLCRLLFIFCCYFPVAFCLCSRPIVSWLPVRCRVEPPRTVQFRIGRFVICRICVRQRFHQNCSNVQQKVIRLDFYATIYFRSSLKFNKKLIYCKLIAHHKRQLFCSR